jgi:hypothetical protein
MRTANATMPHVLVSSGKTILTGIAAQSASTSVPLHGYHVKHNQRSANVANEKTVTGHNWRFWHLCHLAPLNGQRRAITMVRITSRYARLRSFHWLHQARRAYARRRQRQTSECKTGTSATSCDFHAREDTLCARSRADVDLSGGQLGPAKLIA